MGHCVPSPLRYASDLSRIALSWRKRASHASENKGFFGRDFAQRSRPPQAVWGRTPSLCDGGGAELPTRPSLRPSEFRRPDAGTEF